MLKFGDHRLMNAQKMGDISLGKARLSPRQPHIEGELGLHIYCFVTTNKPHGTRKSLCRIAGIICLYVIR